MKNHRILRRALIAATVAGLALSTTSCSRGSEGAGAASGKDSLQFFLNMGPDTPQYAALEKIISGYEKESGVDVEAQPVAVGYEDQMKVKLASKDIPDLFSTHGWSVLRYSAFLEPLTDQPWAKSLNPALDSAMLDGNKQLYAFPGETDVAGLVMNTDVLAKAGVDPASITTWDAFDAAAAAVAATGTTAIYSSGKDQGSAGLMVDFLSADAYTDAQLTQMKDGKFQQEPYASVLTRIAGWQQKGWFNKDYSSASTDDIARALSDGTTGFAFTQNSTLTNALGYNPDAKLAFIPFPGDVSNTPYLVGGEGVDSFGVSKTSAHKQDALAFLDYLAKPENAAALAQAAGAAPGLTGIKVDYGQLTTSFDTYVTPGTVPLKPYFDRVYLPNGAWSSMVTSGDSVITGQSSPQDAATQMGVQYDALSGQ